MLHSDRSNRQTAANLCTMVEHTKVLEILNQIIIFGPAEWMLKCLPLIHIMKERERAMHYKNGWACAFNRKKKWRKWEKIIQISQFTHKNIMHVLDAVRVLYVYMYWYHDIRSHIKYWDWALTNASLIYILFFPISCSFGFSRFFVLMFRLNNMARSSLFISRQYTAHGHLLSTIFLMTIHILVWFFYISLQFFFF